MQDVLAETVRHQNMPHCSTALVSNTCFIACVAFALQAARQGPGAGHAGRVT
jgi:NADH:ubiquinone oxidoreductase subunit 6 (subunit J)